MEPDAEGRGRRGRDLRMKGLGFWGFLLASLHLFRAALTIPTNEPVLSPVVQQATALLNNPAILVLAEEGGEAELPCDIEPTHQGDRTIMVLWFKDSGIPLYSVDGRYGSLETSQSALGSDLGGRSNFNRGPPARLRISRVKPSDQGVFRCRVDFLNSPSRNFLVNLTLAKPPSEPQILSGDGGTELRDIAGPYLVGHDIHLLCIVAGGEPTTKVSWWLEDKQLESRSEESSDGSHLTRLHLGGVSRHLHGKRLSCRAKSTEASTPVVTTLFFQLYFKPEKVEITTANEMISAGRIKQIVCMAYGSNPPANISWYLEGDLIKHHPITESMDGNETRSVLNLRASWEDDGKELTCRAVNPKYPSEWIQDKRTLSVAYAAMAEVKMSSKAPESQLKEGEIVKLTCNVKSNPPPESIMWYHGSELLKETGAEVQVGPLTAESGGAYSCFVKNREGATRSRPIFLNVQYAPFCKPGTEVRTVGTMIKTPVTATCEVMAESEEDLRFSWTFNRNKETVAVPYSQVDSVGLTSHATHTPATEKDFGTLACWAANSVGHQKKPCLVHIIHAKVPERPKECKVERDRREKVEVECVPANDGGLAQQFVLHVVPEGDQLPSFKQLSLEPKFKIRGLSPTKKYNLHIYAKNPVGTSDPPVIIPGVLGPAATEKLTGKVGHEDEKEYWALAGVGAGGGLLISLVLLVTFLCRKKQKKNEFPLNNLGPSVRIRYPGERDADLYDN